MRGLAIIGGGARRGSALHAGHNTNAVGQDGFLVLDEFDASAATNVSWSLHTVANVTVSGLRASLTIGGKTVDATAGVSGCPGR